MDRVHKPSSPRSSSMQTVLLFNDFCLTRPRLWLRAGRFVESACTTMANLVASEVRAAVMASKSSEPVETVLTADRANELVELAAAQRGDSEAYRKIVERYQYLIGTQMRRFTRDVVERDALVQDVFVEAYFSLSNFRGRSPFEHWLRKVAVRVGYRFWKSRTRTRAMPQLSDEQWEQLRGSVAESVTSCAAAELVQELLAMLSPPDRLVLTLIYLDGCTMAAAAERAGWTTIGTKVRASRARQKLRDLLEGGAP